MAKAPTNKAPKPRRQRIDTAAAAVDVMRAGLVEIHPPAHITLEPRDKPFWDSVIAEFAKGEWSAHQLEVAAFLARTMSDLDSEQVSLRAEGSVVKTDKGTPVVNPRKMVVQMHAGNILALRRSLQLHARAKQGEARDTGQRRAKAKDIENDNPLSDDLLGPGGWSAPAGVTRQ